MVDDEVGRKGVVGQMGSEDCGVVEFIIGVVPLRVWGAWVGNVWVLDEVSTWISSS